MPTIAYLTSIYPRASDSFIRGEITQLRQQSFQVHTFSIRRPTADQLLSDEIKKEHAQTTYLLRSHFSLLASCFLLLASLITHPLFTLRTTCLALNLRWPGLKGSLWPFAYLLEASTLAHYLRKKKIQHLHNHIGENSAAVALLAATLAHIPHSHTIHGPYEFDAPHTLHLSTKIAHATFTIAISDFCRSQLYRWSHPDHWPKIHIVHCAVAPEFLTTPATPIPDSPTLLCIGRLCSEKGQLLLLHSLAQLLSLSPDSLSNTQPLGERGLSPQPSPNPQPLTPNPFPHLTFIGDGPSRPLLESAIQSLHLQSHVTLTGWLPAAQIRTQLLSSRALILPSLAEGLPVVLMEALALHRPVLSTTIAAIPELVIPSQTGWLVPPGSVDSLTRALRDLLQTPTPALQKMAAAGAALIHQNHNPQTEATKLATHFHQSIKAHP